MTHARSKRFRLSFVNAAEDVPRLVRAYGRACAGEFALVMRPREGRSVLVLVTKAGARMWRSTDDGTDAPAVPEAAITPADAVKLVKVEQQALPKTSPITLRGQWSGYLYCDDGRPRVELRRKLATYGVLHLESSVDGHWAWRVERTEKWFSEPGADAGKAGTLVGAIEAGLRQAMGLLGEACSLRDSRRRAAYDSAWAETHPVRPAREGKDPTERLKVKPPRKGRAKPPTATPPARSAVDTTSVPGLTIVHVGDTPQTAEELRAFTAGHAQEFETDPKASTAKNWVKSALLHLGLEAVSLSAKTRTFADIGGGRRVFVTVVLPASAEGDAMDAKMRMVSDATPPGLSIEDWDYASAGARRPTRSRGKVVPEASDAEPPGDVDPAKDKALIDAFSAAISAAMGGG
jgi:hypothetical protein